MRRRFNRFDWRWTVKVIPSIRPLLLETHIHIPAIVAADMNVAAAGFPADFARREDNPGISQAQAEFADIRDVLREDQPQGLVAHT